MAVFISSSYLFATYVPHHSSYSRETPSRFKKEIIKALADPITSTIEIDSLNQILVNIGRPQDKLSEADLSLLLAEAGVEETQRSIPVDKIIQLMWGNSKIWRRLRMYSRKGSWALPYTPPLFVIELLTMRGTLLCWKAGHIRCASVSWTA